MQPNERSDERDESESPQLGYTRLDKWWLSVILVVWFLGAVLDGLPNLFGNAGAGAFAQSLIDRHVDVLLTALGLALIATWLVQSWVLRRARR